MINDIWELLLSYVNTKILINTILFTFSLLVVVFWWKKSHLLRVLLITTWFFFVYYRHIEEFLLRHAGSLGLRLSLFVQILLGLCIYILLYAILFSIVSFILSIFLQKDRQDKSWHNFFLVLFIMLFAVGTTIVSMFAAYSKPRIMTYEVRMGQDFLPFRIAIIADLHLRKYMSESIATRAIRATMSVQPDLVLLAGDNMDAPKHVIESMSIKEKLKDLQAPLGVYVISGNNDYEWGFVGSPARRFYNKLNMHLLEDQQVTLSNGVTLIGRDDRTGTPERKTLEEWGKKEKGKKLTIYLEHQPVDLHRHEFHRDRIIVSGHTHGGQFFPLNHFYAWFHKEKIGVKQTTNIVSVVSPGVGFSKAPIRLGVNPEIIVLEVRPAK